MINNTIKLLAILMIALSFSSCGYNSMVGLDENVAEKWGNVQSAYQHRADVTKNLEAIIKGSANFEKDALIAVTNARSKASSINIDPSNITPEAMKNFEKMQSSFSGAMSRLLATFERYPDLKTTAQFKDFMTKYEGAENRIKAERDYYNEAAKEYNTYVRSFPKNMYAGIFGFGRKAYFEASQGSEDAPTIDFSSPKGSSSGSGTGSPAPGAAGGN